jgi:hypothetical protein
MCLGERGGGVGQVLIGADGAGEQGGAGEGEQAEHGPECVADAEDGAESPAISAPSGMVP